MIAARYSTRGALLRWIYIEDTRRRIVLSAGQPFGRPGYAWFTSFRGNSSTVVSKRDEWNADDWFQRDVFQRIELENARQPRCNSKERSFGKSKGWWDASIWSICWRKKFLDSRNTFDKFNNRRESNNFFLRLYIFCCLFVCSFVRLFIYSSTWKPFKKKKIIHL